MSKLYASVVSDKVNTPKTARGDDFISATFTYGSKDDPKRAVTVELGANPFSAHAWVNPELRPKDRGIRLTFVVIGDPQEPPDLVAELFSLPNFWILGNTNDPKEYSMLSSSYKDLADELGLYFDRSALDEYLEQEDPR